MGFMVLFVVNMYEFNLEGFIFSSVLLVVSIYMIIVGYKKGIKKVRTKPNRITVKSSKGGSDTRECTSQ